MLLPINQNKYLILTEILNFLEFHGTIKCIRYQYGSGSLNNQNSLGFGNYN